MRQKCYDMFIDLLNNVGTASINDKYVKLLKTRFVQNNDVDYTTDVLHILQRTDQLTNIILLC